MAASVAHNYTSQLAAQEALQRFRGSEVVAYGTQSRLEVSSSSSHDAYRAPKVAASPPSPAPPPRVAAPFEGRTSYSQDFVRHPPGRLESPPRPPPRAHCPFEGASLYKDQFRAHQLAPAPKPYSPPPRASVPFEGCSTTHATFVQHPQQPAPASPALPARQPIPFQGVSTTHDSYRGHPVAPRRPSLGIATMGDRFHVLIPGSAPVPTSASQVFTTVHAGQLEVCFLVYQGLAPLASANQLLGQFQLGPLPPAPAGSLRIQVTFYLDQDECLTAEAQDVETGQQYQWRLQR